MFNAQNMLAGITNTGFDATKIDDYVKSLNGLNKAQQLAAINSSKLKESEKQLLRERILNTQATNADTGATNANSEANMANATSDKVDTATNEENIASTVSDSAATAENTQRTIENTEANLNNSTSDITDTATNTAAGASGVAAGASVGLGAKLSGAWAAIPLLGKVGIIIAALAAIAGIITGIVNAIKGVKEDELEEIKKKGTEAKEAIDKLKSSFRETKQTTEDLSKRFAELSQGVDDFTGKNVSLSTEDYEEFLDMSNQLAELFPSLSRTYDENGNAIVKLSGNVDTVVGSLQNLIDTERELANQEIVKNLPEVYEGVKLDSDDYQDKINKLQTRQNRISSYYYSNSINDDDAYAKIIADSITSGINYNSTEPISIKVRGIDKSDWQAKEVAEAYQKIFELAGIDYDDEVVLGTIQEQIATDNSGDYSSYYVNANSGVLQELIENNQIDLEQVIKDSGVIAKFKQYDKYVTSNLTTIGQDIENTTTKNKSNWSSLSNSLMSAIQTDGQYKMMNDSAQAYIQNAIGSLDYEELIKQFEEEGIKDADKQYEKLQQHIQDNILGLFNNSEVQNLTEELFKLDFSNMPLEEIKSSMMEYINQIVKIAEELEIEGIDSSYLLKIFGLDGYVTVADNFAQFKDQIARSIVGVKDGELMDHVQSINYAAITRKIDQFAEEYSINTQDELAAFNDAWEKANGDINRAFSLYLEYLQNKNKKTPFDQAFNASSFKEQKEELLELAKAGELTPETLESTEEYVELLNKTGLSAESCKDKIYDLLSVQEKLAGAHTGIDNLKSSYEEFKEFGFVTAKTLESLPDEWKESLEGYDLFSQIVGNPKSGTEAIQQAFNDIVKEYLILIQTLNTDDFLSDDLKAQQHAIQVYTANLKKMGIVNADQVVQQTVESLKASDELFKNAEQEYIDYLRSNEEDYMGYLTEKNKVDLEYIESTASYNAQFINSLGQGYETDYNNWIGLLRDKELAYQRFAKSLDGNKDGEFVYDPSKNIIENLIANGKGTSFHEIVEAETAKAEYDRITQKYEELRKSLIFNPEFTSDLSINWDGTKMGSGSDSSSDTTFDFIETRLSKLNDALEETKEIAEDTFNGWAERSNAYDTALAKIIELRTEQEKAKARYLAEANKSGISDDDRKLVEYGDIEGINAILKSSDEERIKQIQSYQEWYDKAKACDDAIVQLNKDYEEMYRDSRTFRWDNFDYLLESISRLTEEAEYLIGLLSEEDLFNDKGNMTKYADATLSLRFANIDAYTQSAKDYLEEIESLKEEVSKEGASQETIDRYNDLVNAHRDAINAINDEKNAVLDLVEEGYQKQLDYLRELIDKKKESLNVEKDIYDYQKSIEEQSKKVTSLQRQYDVYKNDTSEEGIAQAQKIKVELEAAQEELEQTQYEKYLADQESMLDKLASDYETWMNDRLDREEELLAQIRENTAQKDSDVVSTLEEVTSNNNTEFSSDIATSIIDGTTTAINNLVDTIIKALGGNASHLGNVGTSDTLKGLPQYASGTKRSGKEWAWTQEEGVELIRTKDGALLTPLDNSMVFNNESSRRLWEFSQNPADYLAQFGMQAVTPQIDVLNPKLPEVARNISSSPVINLGGINIVCNEVSNADEIVNDLISNKKFEKAMYSAVGNVMTGGNSLSKYRH